jgi:phage repressor protein C with HTH and peptisase S24 domain
MKGSEFKILLKVKGLTQEAAADLIQVSRQTINTWCKLDELDKDVVETIQKRLNVKTLDKIGGVPVYDVDVTAGNSLDFSNHLPEKIKGYISLPNFQNCFAFIMVRGDSMYPKFKAGDLIGLELVNDMEIIQWGHAYVIVTHDNQRMLKYVRKGKDDQHLILKSEDSHYDDISLPRKKIIQLYMAKGPVRDDWQ